ncbi:MAG: AAA family ATPase [Proteobacteria bacterium]|nr:AAA family ATPase [Pseudomonadota bacterium]
MKISSIGDFENIRNDQCHYADKTDLIYKMIQNGRYYFLSRPRRFGKGLLVSTMNALFKGKKDLFKGLYIEDKWDWSQKYPVIKFSFIGECRTPNGIEESMIAKIYCLEKKHDINNKNDTNNIGKATAIDRFKKLIRHLHEKTGQKVVILIDEYDTPIRDVITEANDMIKNNRNYLNNFFRGIHECDDHIRFMFLTGITMFSKDGIFSGLKKLKDISIDEEYGSICGFTDHELDTVFAEEIKGLDREKIKKWYNGYNWLGKEKVYNPCCILYFLQSREFNNWVFRHCTSSHLYEYITATKRLDLEDLENCWIEHKDLETFNIDRTEPKAMLFQSGHLTIAKKVDDGKTTKYLLKYPNIDASNAVKHGLISYLSKEVRLKNSIDKLFCFFKNNEFTQFKKSINYFLANVYRKDEEYAAVESYYHSIIFTIFYFMHPNYNSMRHSSLEASNITLICKDKVLIIDLKVAQPGSSKETTLQRSIQQNKNHGYIDKYKELKKSIYLLAIMFSKDKQNFVDLIHDKIDYSTT